MSANSATNQKNRAFLKWAGGKFKLIDQISAKLPQADTLVEPFVGAGSVFLNTDYSRYVLNDINPDLINLYKTLQAKPDAYIADVRRYFVPENNTREAYLDLRQRFNQSTDTYERSTLFLYLNKHCFNGLCRYNKSGGFNVPFGRFKKVTFQQELLEKFAEKAQKATFYCKPYEDIFALDLPSAVYYCDPPYAPISDTAKFTQYAKGDFSLEDQQNLALLAEKKAKQDRTPVLLSNHDTELTNLWYRNAEISKLQVWRSISQIGSSRQAVGELLALYRPD